MASITLKGREVPLIYTTWEMKQIQEELGPLSRAISMALGQNPENKEDTSKYGSAEHLASAAKLIRILGNAGLEEAGEAADLSDKKVLRALRPNEMITAINACLDAMAEGMESEIPPKETKGPVDVTLEEMNAKKKKTG